MTINEDESGTFALLIGFDEEFKQLMDQGGGEGGFELTEGLEDVPEGWNVEEVVEDGFEVMKVSSAFDSLDELDSRLAELGDTADTGVGTEFLGDFNLTHEGDDFRFEVDVSGLDEELTGALGEQGGSDDLLSGIDPSTLFEDLFEIRFRLTLPGTIGANNADAVDGNTLTWNLDMGSDGGELYATSTTGGGSSTMLVGGAAVAAAALVGVGVAASRRRKKNASVEAVTNSPI